MTKEDYMKLPKERLAELLVEMEKSLLPVIQMPPQTIIHQEARPLCYEPGGTCTNPQMDCINCPRKNTGGTWTTNTGTM